MGWSRALEATANGGFEITLVPFFQPQTSETRQTHLIWWDVVGDEEGQSTMTRTRREKTAFSFDFAQPLDTTRKAIFQASTVALTLPGYKPPKPKSQRKIIKKITGSKTSAGSKQMLEQHCLPDDMHFNAAQLLRFDMKPKATVIFSIHLSLLYALCFLISSNPLFLDSSICVWDPVQHSRTPWIPK